MPTFLIKFIISMFISTWVYNEFTYFLPESKPYLDKAVNYINIPSHADFLDSSVIKNLELKEASKIYKEIQNELKNTSLGTNFKHSDFLNSEWFNTEAKSILLKQASREFDLFKNSSFLQNVSF